MVSSNYILDRLIKILVILYEITMSDLQLNRTRTVRETLS